MFNSLKDSRKRWWILFVVQFSNLIASIDSTIVNVSLPTIATETKARLGTAQWVITGYLLTVMMGLLVAGRLADVRGKKLIFNLGFVLFTVGSVLCGAAPDCRWLIAARVLQAIGAASLLANANAILTDAFEGTERGIALGLNSTIVAVGYALGYVLGGVLTEHFGWRSIFYVNAPLGAAAVALCHIVLDDDVRPRNESDAVAFDWKGALLSCIGLGGLLYGADRIGEYASIDRTNVIIISIGAAAFFLFVRSQLVVKHPLVHLELFKLQNVSIGLGCLFCFTATLASCSFVFPFYLQGVLGLSASETGLVMAPYSLALCVVAPVAGWLTARMHPGWMSASGFLVGATVCLVYSRLGCASSFWWVAAGQFGLGLSGATFLSPNRIMVLSSVPAEDLGVASALIQGIRFFGLSIGAMGASLIFENMLGSYGGMHTLLESPAAMSAADIAFIRGLDFLFPVMAMLLILGAFACAWNARHPEAISLERKPAVHRENGVRAAG